MRFLIGITTTAFVLWSAYWVVGTWGLDRGIAAGLEGARARGWSIAQDDIGIAGYPNRFDVTVTNPRIGDPQARLTWAAPFVKLFALSYRPNHLIAVFPPEQTVTGPFGTVSLGAGDLRASLVLGASTDLPLDRSVLDGTGLTLATPERTLVSVADLGIATQRNDAATNAHRLGLDLKAVAPDPAFMARLDPQSRLPAVIDALRLDATVTLDRAIDRKLTALPRMTALSLAEARLSWGQTEISAKGDLAISADGTPEGRIDISARNWQALLDLVTDIGLLRAETRPTVQRMLETLQSAGGEGAALTLPLVLAGGRASLGPVPLGRAPRLPGYALP